MTKIGKNDFCEGRRSTLRVWKCLSRQLIAVHRARRCFSRANNVIKRKYLRPVAAMSSYLSNDYAWTEFALPPLKISAMNWTLLSSLLFSLERLTSFSSNCDDDDDDNLQGLPLCFRQDARKRVWLPGRLINRRMRETSEIFRAERKTTLLKIH